MAGVLDFDFKGEIGFLLYNEGKEEHIWDLGPPCLLLLPCLVVKANGKPQESICQSHKKLRPFSKEGLDHLVR